MTNKNKKLFLFFLFTLLVFAFILNTHLAFAETVPRNLEVQYPQVQGFKPELVITPMGKYAKYIFNFAIWISGLIALIVLIYAGFEYFTSAGDPGRIQDSKNRISAAFLGLIILFGSYLLLISINPELISFHIERLRPIMSELRSGALVCKNKPQLDSGKDAVLEAWNLLAEYKLLNTTIEREREIKEKLDEALDKIALECYTTSGASDITPDFDNKIQYIYFIPLLETKEVQISAGNTRKQITKITEYGAIIYEESGYGGRSQLLGSNLINPQGTADVYFEPVLINASSIKPFALIYTPDPNWEVVLYQESNENRGVGGLTPLIANITTNPGCLTQQNQGQSSKWWCDFNLPWPPKSIRIKGDLLVLLCKDKLSVDSCEVFSKGVDNNLEDNLNIINWVSCKEYESSVSRGIIFKDCAQAAATRMIVLSAISL